jgi:hypothetical protein
MVVYRHQNVGHGHNLLIANEFFENVAELFGSTYLLTYLLTYSLTHSLTHSMVKGKVVPVL